MLILLLYSGCLATSKHVKKGDFLMKKIAKETNVSPQLQAEINTHVATPAGITLPETKGTPIETLLGGMGGIGGLAYGLYKSFQRKQAEKNKLALEQANIENEKLLAKMSVMDREESTKEYNKFKGEKV